MPSVTRLSTSMLMLLLEMTSRCFPISNHLEVVWNNVELALKNNDKKQRSNKFKCVRTFCKTTTPKLQFVSTT